MKLTNESRGVQLTVVIVAAVVALATVIYPLVIMVIEWSTPAP